MSFNKKELILILILYLLLLYLTDFTQMIFISSEYNATVTHTTYKIHNIRPFTFSVICNYELILTNEHKQKNQYTKYFANSTIITNNQIFDITDFEYFNEYANKSAFEQCKLNSTKIMYSYGTNYYLSNMNEISKKIYDDNFRKYVFIFITGLISLSILY